MKIGFIGCGNMATAMIKGILGAGIAGADEVCASAKSAKTQDKIRNELGIGLGTNKEVASWADMLFLAVKPQYYEEVIREISADVREDAILVTIAPGKSLAWLEETFGRSLKIVRTMPNTPAMVQEGMTGICPNDKVTEEDLEKVMTVCNSFGKTEVISEHLLDAVTAVAGCSPAYIFMVIEAMADGAVAGGMPRAQAYRFAAQAVLGSAKMVLETGMHPGELKDMVCSPAGVTIQAVRVLEEKGVRAAFIDAEKTCLDMSGKM